MCARMDRQPKTPNSSRAVWVLDAEHAGPRLPALLVRSRQSLMLSVSGPHARILGRGIGNRSAVFGSSAQIQAFCIARAWLIMTVVAPGRLINACTTVSTDSMSFVERKQVDSSSLSVKVRWLCVDV